LGTAKILGTPNLPGPGQTRLNPIDGLTYVWIPAGQFMMGCSRELDAYECNDNDLEKPVHKVTISKGFWMGQAEVTQDAYQKVMGTNPSRFRGADLPVENVRWNDASAYCGNVGLRLPTEAEWEYAARAGTTSARYGSLDQVAWHPFNSDSKTHPVKGKDPNAWGLYDMLGNVWEWVSDWYGPYKAQAVVDPPGPVKGLNGDRVIRGGGWEWNPRPGVHVSARDGSLPLDRHEDIGFRCAGELR
jgi:formylglycine-generating enzyme required for sulfatase activity